VDFSQETVIVAAMGSRPSGGYDISIESIVASGDVVDVFTKSTSPGVRCATTQALTSPVVIMKIAAVERPVQFHDQAETRNCG
jgi:hypothetical protein